MNKRSGWVAIIVGTLTATLPVFVLFRMVTLLFVVPLVLGLLCVLLGVTALRKEGKYGRHVGWISVTVMLIAVIFPFGTIAYYNESGFPVEIVIPSGFIGPIWIVEDKQVGESVPIVEGRYRVTIPRSGVLKLSTMAPFTRWHSVAARYTDGKTLPIDGATKVPENIIGLRDSGGIVAIARAGREVRFIAYYVGTRNEAKQFLETPSDPP